MALIRVTAALAASLALALPSTASAAAQTIVTGYNDGSAGAVKMVYGVNVGPERFQPRTFGLFGDCNYMPGGGVNADSVPIVVEGHAVATASWDLAAVVLTSVRCEVVSPTRTIIATMATAGATTAAVGLGQVTLNELGTLEICVTVTARFTDTTTATSDRACLPPDGILAARPA